MKKAHAWVVGALGVAVALSIALAGCGSSSSGSSNTTSTGSTSTSSTTSTTKNSTDYPVTITTYDYSGNEIQTTYAQKPQRVVAVYQGSIETLIALGCEDSVVKCYGLDNAVKDEWADGLAKMNYDSSVFAPDKETVTMLEPDMILSWGSLFSDKKLDDNSTWIANGVNTYINTNTRKGGTRTLENEYADIENLGEIFDVQDKADEIVNEMKDEVSTTIAATKGKASPKVQVVEFGDSDISNYGADTLAGDMVTTLGGTLAAPDADSIGKEDLIATNPDVIFVIYMPREEDGGDAVKDEMLAKLTDDSAFADLSAVKNGRVYALMLGDCYASGVRTIDGIKTIEAGMYPDLAK